MHYLDTSVLVALYIPEPASAKVQKYLARLRTTAISGLTEVEFHSAIARRVRMKDLAREDAMKLASLFKLHVEDHVYRMIPVEQSEYGLARDWLASFRTSLRTLDAMHLAVAFSNDFTIVTADKDLARSAKHLGVKCKLVA